MGLKQKHINKIIALMVIVVLSTGMLAGCSGSSSSNTSSAENETATNDETNTLQNKGADKTEITFWHTWGAGLGTDALEKLVDSYNSTNDKNIHVNLSYVASQSSGNTQTMEKLMSSIAAGNPPEIALLDNFQIASWADQNALVAMDDMLGNAGMDMNNFYEWAQEGSYYKDSVYSIPYNGDCRALFYNKDMFAAAGLDPENPPSTIAELEDAAVALTKKNGNSFDQVGFIPWQNAGKPIYTWGWSFGADFYDKDKNVLTIATDQTIEALQWEVDFARKFGLEDFVNYANGLGTNAEDPFITGKLAMCIRGNFDIATIKTYNPDLNYGVAPIPSKEEGKNITWCGGWGLTIPKGAKNQEASMDFFAYAAGEEGQRLMAENSGSLSILPNINQEIFADDQKNKVFIDMLDNAYIRPSVPVGQELWDNLNSALELALHEQDTPENLLKQIDENINKELQNKQ